MRALCACCAAQSRACSCGTPMMKLPSSRPCPGQPPSRRLDAAVATPCLEGGQAVASLTPTPTSSSTSARRQAQAAAAAAAAARRNITPLPPVALPPHLGGCARQLPALPDRLRSGSAPPRSPRAAARRPAAAPGPGLLLRPRRGRRRALLELARPWLLASAPVCWPEATWWTPPPWAASAPRCSDSAGSCSRSGGRAATAAASRRSPAPVSAPSCTTCCTFE